MWLVVVNPRVVIHMLLISQKIEALQSTTPILGLEPHIQIIPNQLATKPEGVRVNRAVAIL